MAQEEREAVGQVEHLRELPPAWRHCTPVRRCIGRDPISSGPLLLHLHCHHVPLRRACSSTDMCGCAPHHYPTSIAASITILYLDPKKRTIDLLFARDAATSAAPVETVGRQHRNTEAAAREEDEESCRQLGIGGDSEVAASLGGDAGEAMVWRCQGAMSLIAPGVTLQEEAVLGRSWGTSGGSWEWCVGG